MFHTPLHVAQMEAGAWRIEAPLIWEGRWEYIVVRSGFVSDLASLPRLVHWAAGRSCRHLHAMVLYDAVLRDSMRHDGRIDPWHADGILRRALRETGTTALTRGVVWLAARMVAIFCGRMGKMGPTLSVKILQFATMSAILLVSVTPAAVLFFLGSTFYWVLSWSVALIWYVIYEGRNLDAPPNLPWPLSRQRPVHVMPFDRNLIVVIPKPATDRPEQDIPAPEPGDDGQYYRTAPLEVADEIAEAIATAGQFKGAVSSEVSDVSTLEVSDMHALVRISEEEIQTLIATGGIGEISGPPDLTHGSG